MRNINIHIHTQPKETVAAADALIGQMLDSLLSDSDIAIHLMNGKKRKFQFNWILPLEILLFDKKMVYLLIKSPL